MERTILCHRLFWALVLRKPIDAQIINFTEEVAPGFPHMRKDRLHVTMGLIPDFPEDPVAPAAKVRGISDEITADPFEMIVDRLSGNGGTLALRPSRRIEGLFALRGQIVDVARRAGVALRQSFNPHITLAYRDGVPFTRTIEGFGWWVDELVLIHSLVGLTEHRILGRWPLRGRDDPQLSLF
ncbi:MAG: 2,5 ligase [Sphingomonas bacterium]|nr:2,5 ligase [Sphingomonas bacterium]